MSGTRKEELLYHPSELEKIQLLRQATSNLTPIEAMNRLIGRLKKTGSNAEFLLSLKNQDKAIDFLETLKRLA